MAFLTLACQKNNLAVADAKVISVRYSIGMPCKEAGVEVVSTQQTVYTVPIGTAVEIAAFVEGLPELNKERFVQIHWVEDDVPAAVSRKKGALRYACTSHAAARLTLCGKAESLHPTRPLLQSADMKCVIQWVDPKDFNNQQGTEKKKETPPERYKVYDKGVLLGCYKRPKEVGIEIGTQTESRKDYKATELYCKTYVHPSKKKPLSAQKEPEEISSDAEFHDFANHNQDLKTKYIDVVQDYLKVQDEIKQERRKTVQLMQKIDHLEQQLGDTHSTEQEKQEQEEAKRLRLEEERRKQEEKELQRKEEEQRKEKEQPSLRKRMSKFFSKLLN